MILDTDFVIDLMKKEENAVAKQQKLDEDHEVLMVTAPTIFELWSGITSIKKSEGDKQKMAALLREQIIYTLNDESAEAAGIIHGELIKKGLTIEPVDCMIAGIAKIHNKPVLTRDEYFRRIEGLKVEKY